jgi:nitroimidazol reductase NimA-like FMN-containing flavoprotein (pyridoxamine 5'-phosphate oxidase superfamily)
MTRTLSEVEARELIRSGKIGHLGCIVKGEPCVVPLNYLLDGDWIYSHSLPGRKIGALRVNPRVCLQVEQFEDDFHCRSAIAFGNYEEVHDALDRAQVLRKLLRRFPKLTPVESRVVEDAAPPEVIVFRIAIERVTGVAEG